MRTERRSIFEGPKLEKMELIREETSQREVAVCNLGRTRFAEAWDLQRQLFQLRLDGRIPDVLLLTEHEPVYTIGKSGSEDHLIGNQEFLRQQGVEVLWIDRGGDITYHGPGQLVAYPIIDLQNFYLDVHRYLRDLEEAIILALQEYGVSAGRDPRYTGVWVAGKKIAAIGVKVSRWITMHGVAVNVNPDLRYFDWIVPCGISDRGVTSLEKVLHDRGSADAFKTDVNDFAPHFVQSFAKVFGLDPVPTNLAALQSAVEYHPKEPESCLP